MSEGYSFIGSVVGPENEPLASMLVAGGFALALGLSARASLQSASSPLVPAGKLTIRNLFEVIAEFLIWLGDSAMGKENRKYLPFAGSLFVFILFMNLMGLLPGFTMATHKPTINAGLAVIVFILYNFWGIKEVGLLGYLKHMWGPIFALGFFLFPLEIVSHLIRPLSLTLRLFGNMTGDHMVLSIFTDLTRSIYVPVPVIFYCLGTIICFIQAFVFTLLTMIYIRLAVAHEEEH